MALARDKRYFLADIIHLYIFETYKVVFNVQGILNFPNAALVLVHGQVFNMTTWQRRHSRNPLSSHPRTVLCSFKGRVLRTTTSTPSNQLTLYLISLKNIYVSRKLDSYGLDFIQGHCYILVRRLDLDHRVFILNIACYILNIVDILWVTMHLF